MAARADDWLDSIRIASPCDQRWEDMTGDDRSRFCDRCELSVFNLAGMTRAEAAELVRERGGNLCAQIARRADGTLLMRDCPAGLARVRRRIALLAVGVVGLVIGAVGLVAAAVGGRRPAARWNPTAGWSQRLPKPFRTVVKPFDAEPVRMTRGKMICVTPPAPPAPPPTGQ